VQPLYYLKLYPTPSSSQFNMSIILQLRKQLEK
jgi:hypothetical protein